MSRAWLCCTVCISALNSGSTGFVFVKRMRAVWYNSRAMIVERLMSLEDVNSRVCGNQLGAHHISGKTDFEVVCHE